MGENKPKYVLYEKRGNIAVLTLNRPEVLNAISPDVYIELLDLLRQVDADEGVDIVVLTGKGRAFSAGGDINVMAELKDADRLTRLGLAVKYFTETGEPTFKQLIRMSKPVIAMVNGLAYGAGFDLVLCSDIAIASEKATFRLAEGRIGSAATNVAQLIAERAGSARAKELALTCDTIDAKEAERIGLINKVVSDDKLEEVVMETARKVTTVGPVARRLLKAAVNRRLPERDIGPLMESHAAEDVIEGVKAFAEKRAPKWVKS
ncbi:enoyl-CoA hydratase/isomerase family protein [Chloroflexota bacterium]